MKKMMATVGIAIGTALIVNVANCGLISFAQRCAMDEKLSRSEKEIKNLNDAMVALVEQQEVTNAYLKRIADKVAPLTK